MKLITILCLLWLCFVGLYLVIYRSSIRDFFHEEPHIEIAFLDIGQGDATLITFPDKRQMLVDCSIDARVLEALQRHMSFFDRSIDFLVVTHPDRDHYGGCIDILKRFSVDHVVYTGVKEDNEFYRLFQDEIGREGASYSIVDKQVNWSISSTTLSFLYPFESFDGLVVKDKNNTSIVLKLTYASTSVLLTGDSEEEVEKTLIDRYGSLIDVDVLKAGHHGAANATTRAFLEATTPEHLIVSAGKDNAYGHPSYRMLQRVDADSTQVWRTDTMGDILIYIDNRSWYVTNTPF